MSHSHWTFEVWTPRLASNSAKSFSALVARKFFAYGDMTVVLSETVVTLLAAQLMCLVLGVQAGHAFLLDGGGRAQWRKI